MRTERLKERRSLGQVLHIRSAACLNSSWPPSSLNSKLISLDKCSLLATGGWATQMSSLVWGENGRQLDPGERWLALWLIVGKHAMFGGDGFGSMKSSWTSQLVDFFSMRGHLLKQRDPRVHSVPGWIWIWIWKLLMHTNHTMTSSG